MLRLIREDLQCIFKKTLNASQVLNSKYETHVSEWLKKIPNKKNVFDNIGYRHQKTVYPGRHQRHRFYRGHRNPWRVSLFKG